MLRAAQTSVCRTRHKNAYIATGQSVSFDWHPVAAVISFSAHEVLFEGPFFVGRGDGYSARPRSGKDSIGYPYTGEKNLSKHIGFEKFYYLCEQRYKTPRLIAMFDRARSITSRPYRAGGILRSETLPSAEAVTAYTSYRGVCCEKRVSAIAGSCNCLISPPLLRTANTI